MPEDLRLNKTGIEGLYVITSKVIDDKRGAFVKVFQHELFKESDDLVFKEIYYSISGKNVIRGMHFQIPPHTHSKLIYVPAGSIIDVVLDIRGDSETFGEYLSFELNDKKQMGLLIPVGLAHGFRSLTENTIVCYQQTSGYNPDADKGIKWDSFGFNWDVPEPIISKRDLTFDSFEKFIATHKNIFVDEKH